MNIIQIAGRLGADPESRFTPGGQKVTSLRVATNSRRNGKDETTWWRVTIWGDRFDKMLTYLKKGSAIIVMGELRVDQYTDKAGQTQVALDITADIIRFSPFGSPERGTQEQAGDQPAGYVPQASAAGREVADGPFQGSGSHNYSAAGSSAKYPAGGQSMGRSSSPSQAGDDDLPF